MKIFVSKLKILKNNQTGFGLVEVIAALGISIVVLTSLVSLALFTLRSSLNSKLYLEGTNIANRELELVRAYRDIKKLEWTDVFVAKMMICTLATPCHMDLDAVEVINGPAITDLDGPKQLTRYFYATDTLNGALTGTETEVRINVVVEWKVADKTKYARLHTDLTNWQNK